METQTIVSGIFIDAEKKEISTINVGNSKNAISLIIGCKTLAELRLDGNVLCIDKQAMFSDSEDKRIFRFFEIQFIGNGLILGNAKDGSFTDVSKPLDWAKERITFVML